MWTDEDAIEECISTHLDDHPELIDAGMHALAIEERLRNLPHHLRVRLFEVCKLVEANP